MIILAHKDGDRIQTLTEHSYNVACLARDEASTINQGHVLFLLGLYHDLGKADRKFQEKLTNNPDIHVDHSYAGALYLCTKISQQKGHSVFSEIITFLGGRDIAVGDTPWRTIHPNHDKVTVAVKSYSNPYITVTSKTKQRDVEYTNNIKLTQGQYVKEKAIDNVIIDGDGPILDKVQYGTETTRYAIFGQPVFIAKSHRSALRFVYKQPESNKTLDDMLK